MTSQREYTTEEMAQLFIDCVRVQISQWQRADCETIKDHLEGVAFSILALIDGVAGIPAFILAPDANIDENGEDDTWYPIQEDAVRNGIKCDTSGGLHELFCKSGELR